MATWLGVPDHYVCHVLRSAEVLFDQMDKPMGICSIVMSAAHAVAMNMGPLSGVQAEQASILCRMGEYAQARDLGAWEQMFVATAVDESTASEVDELLWEIFEFGRLNLYGAIDVEETAHALVDLRAAMARHGITEVAVSSVDAW